VHVGCDASSSTPICDADSSTSAVDDSAVEKRASCVNCKKDGTYNINTILIIQSLFQNPYILINTTHYSMFILDGITTGDGTSSGKCPSNNCLSNGYCNVCGQISGYAEGCSITSTTPVCDGDSSTSGTQDFTAGKVAQCVACTKSGNLLLYIY